MIVQIHHKQGVCTSLSFLDDALNPNPDYIHAPIEHEEQEIIGEMAEKEKALREAQDKLDLQADDQALQDLLNPKKKPAPKEDSDKDDSASDDSEGDASDGDDDMGTDDEGLDV